VAIVWVCSLSVDAYCELGRGVEVPRFDCPTCGKPMALWGFYSRYLRFGACVRVGIRRQRCGACRRSHGVLPGFVTYQRLDELEAIGTGIEAMVGGNVGARRAAAALSRPHSTVRDWRRRFRARAVLLATGIAAAVVATTGTVARLHADPEQACLQAMAAAGQALASRGRTVGNCFVVANVICGSHLLSTNTHPPWALA
jgi:transposase-like protein